LNTKRAKLASDGKAKKNLIGDHVRYLGLGGKRYECPVCNRTFSRGFYYQQNSQNGCTRVCLESQISQANNE
jgi:transposase-like protein